MYWVIEYKDNKSISGKEENFKFIPKQNIKSLYLIDGKDIYGVFSNGHFFINNKNNNFKVLKEPEQFFQFKTASVNLNNGQNLITSWNIGYEIYFSKHVEKYTMKVTNKREVYLIAQKLNLNLEKIDERILKLQ